MRGYDARNGSQVHAAGRSTGEAGHSIGASAGIEYVAGPVDRIRDDHQAQATLSIRLVAAAEFALPIAVAILGLLAVAFDAMWVFGSSPGSGFRLWDGATYIAMARNASADFLVGGIPSRKYGPAWPVAIAAAARFGVGWRAAGFIAYLWLVAMAFALTNFRYGGRAALLVAGSVATLPFWLYQMMAAFGDTLLSGAYMLVVFWILPLPAEATSAIRRLSMPAAGLWAAVVALTKNAFLPFLAVGAAVGLAWRLRFRGARNVASDMGYVAGGVVFVGLVGLWVWRNVRDFGFPAGLNMDPYSTSAAWALIEVAPQEWPMASFAAALLLLWIAWPWALVDWRRFRFSETSTGLLIAVALPLVAAGLYMAAYGRAEHIAELSPGLWQDNVRYILPCVVPFAWLALETQRPRRAMWACFAGCLWNLWFLFPR